MNIDAVKGFTGPTVVRKTTAENWITVDPVVYRADEDTVFTIPAGSGTDFASIPRIVAWLVPRSGDSVPAAVLHDYLWRVVAPMGGVSYRDADGLLRQALRVCGVPFVMRWLCWTAVRWGALTRKRGKVGWWKDSGQVLLWTLLALPVVTPPALVVGAALVVVQIAEGVAWLVLRPWSRKKVNSPQVTLRT